MAAPAAEGPHSLSLDHQNIRQFTITYVNPPAVGNKQKLKIHIQ